MSLTPSMKNRWYALLHNFLNYWIIFFHARSALCFNVSSSLFRSCSVQLKSRLLKRYNLLFMILNVSGSTLTFSPSALGIRTPAAIFRFIGYGRFEKNIPAGRWRKIINHSVMVNSQFFFPFYRFFAKNATGSYPCTANPFSERL